MNRFVVTGTLIFAIFLAIVLETTVINFPFIFFIGATLLILIKKIPVCIGATILGFVIDSLRVTNFGLTPLFLIVLMLAIFLYERYTGSKDYVVATIIVIATGIFYARILSYSTMLTWGFIAISLGSWYIYHRFSKRSVRTSYL